MCMAHGLWLMTAHFMPSQRCDILIYRCLRVHTVVSVNIKNYHSAFDLSWCMHVVCYGNHSMLQHTAAGGGMPRHAAECRTCRSMPQHAAACRGRAAACRNVPRRAAVCCGVPCAAARRGVPQHLENPVKHIHCTWTRQDATATALVKTNTPPHGWCPLGQDQPPLPAPLPCFMLFKKRPAHPRGGG